MSMSVTARYSSLGGAVVEVQRNAVLGLLAASYYAWCDGCEASVTEEVNPNVVGGLPPQDAVDRWAREHAATCRRMPF
ncbi:hypothetical protein ACWCXH_14410 [Kitasatospora sp. NPDC001660]